MPTLNAFDNGDVRTTVIVFHPHYHDGARVQGDTMNTLTSRMGTGGNKNLKTLTDKTLNQIQEAIQARRPNHSVQVAPWGTWGEVVIYYRMKNAHYMDHNIK